MWNGVAHNAEMVKKLRQTRSPALIAKDQDGDIVYLGEWLKALGIRPAKLATATGLNEGYISQLINGKKSNPSRDFLKTVATELGLQWRDLYEPPPDRATLEAARRYPAAVLDRLGRDRKD